MYSSFSQNNQAWLERNQEKFGSRQVIHVISRCSITDSLSRRSFLLCTDSLSIAKLRSSSATWCSPKPRLQSACSGKAASWCAGPLASVFRCSIWLPVSFFFLLFFLRLSNNIPWQVRVKRMDGLPAQFYRS